MKAKIVVADDEPRIRKMIARLLTDEGYDVMPVENGREAVEALLSFQPDVILLDQQMPVLTGVEALRRSGVSPRPRLSFCDSLRFHLPRRRRCEERGLRLYRKAFRQR